MAQGTIRRGSAAPGARRILESLALSLAVLIGAALACAPATAADASSRDPAAAAREGNPRAELVLRALSLLGVNYKLGGNSPDTGLDCSGLVRHVFGEAMGLILPRRAEEMSRTGDEIGSDQLRPGDLVFFNTLRRAFSHVGIYIGNNQFVHAPSSGGSVRVESLSGRYWVQRFNGARRVLAIDSSHGHSSGPTPGSGATQYNPSSAAVAGNVGASIANREPARFGPFGTPLPGPDRTAAARTGESRAIAGPYLH